MPLLDAAPLGIAAIATHQPARWLANDWFGGTLARKFVHHTGIETRAVAEEDEVTLGQRAVSALQEQTACDLRRCAALVFVSPSFVPLSVAREHLDEPQANAERLSRAARALAGRLKIPACPAVGINWFCCGYSQALAIVQKRLAPRLKLAADEFVIVVTACRISRITDYGCKQTAGLFGDLATATLIASLDNRRHPIHFDLLHAHASRQSAEGVYFNFHMRDDVLAPSAGGGQDRRRRLVFSLDGMGIADTAPRAMAGALSHAIAAAGIDSRDIAFVVPHQAGSGIVRLTAMKLEQAGIGGEVVNGLTQRYGNTSSGSVPLALAQSWDRLHGIVGCPTAAVGRPGKAEVLEGCILLRSTSHHERMRRAAA